MLKKIIISTTCLMFLLFPISSLKAQTFTSEQSVVIEELKAQLIQILLQQIAVLQEQIKQLIAQQNLSAQQAETGGAVETINKRVEDIAVGGSSENLLISVGDVVCSTRYNSLNYVLPLTIEGEWISGLVQFSGLDMSSRGDFFYRTSFKNGTSEIKLGAVKDRNPYSVSSTDFIAGNKGRYEIKLYNQMPIIRGPGRGFLSPFGDLLLEKSGTFTLPSCQ